MSSGDEFLGSDTNHTKSLQPMYLSMYASIGVSFFLLSIFIFLPSITYHLSISNYHISIICLTLSSSVSTYPFTKMSVSRCSFLALGEKYFKSLLHEKIIQTSSKELAAGDHHPWWQKWFLGTQSFGAKGQLFYLTHVVGDHTSNRFAIVGPIGQVSGVMEPFIIFFLTKENTLYHKLNDGKIGWSGEESPRTSTCFADRGLSLSSFYKPLTPSQFWFLHCTSLPMHCSFWVGEARSVLQESQVGSWQNNSPAALCHHWGSLISLS